MRTPSPPGCRRPATFRKAGTPRCRTRPGGNTPAAPGRRPNTPAAMERRPSRRAVGSVKTGKAVEPMRWESCLLTNGACTTCTATSGNGARMFTMPRPTASESTAGQRRLGARRMPVKTQNIGPMKIEEKETTSASFAAAPGAIRPGSAAQRIAAGSGPTIASGATASACACSPVR